MSTQSPAAGSTAATPLSDPQATLQANYYSNLVQKATSVAAGIFNVTLTPISAASLGGFNYIWENPDGSMNENTFNFISSRVVSGTPAHLSGPISTVYEDLLAGITFKLSTADTQAVNAANTRSTDEAQALVSQYEFIYGGITQAMLQAAAVNTKSDYIIQYVVGTQWSGQKPALKMADLADAQNLSALLPNIPPSGASLLPLVSAYLTAYGEPLALEDREQNGLGMLATITGNTQKPTSDNGGIQTNGKSGPQTRVGFSIGAPLSAIQNDLENSSRSISLQMAASESSQETVSVSVEQSSAVIVPVDWFAVLSGESGGAINVFSLSGAGSSVDVNLTFTGYSWVPIAVSQYQEDTKSGWMSPEVLAEARENQGKDVTGFTFNDPPQMDLGEGGQFGLLTGVLISNYPTVTLTYQNGDYSEFKQSFQENSAWSMSLLDILIGNLSAGAYRATSQQLASGNGFTVTFAPSKELLSVADPDKQAYVLGGSIAYPGTGSVT